MKSQHIRPPWWQLYLTQIILFGLFVLETNAPFSEAGHVWVEAGLVLLLFGSGLVWLKFNKSAFDSNVKDLKPVSHSRFGDDIRRS